LTFSSNWSSLILEVGRRLKIVAMGDSTTAGTPAFLSPLESPPFGEGNVESQYAYWLMREHSDWDVLNKGINGQRSDQVLARFKRDVLDENPRIAVILAGVNDIFQRYPAEAPEKNLAKMYDLASDAGIIPVACTVLPYDVMGKGEAAVRRELNGWVQSESRRREIPFCDTAAAASRPKDLDKLSGSPDGLHPDVNGYRSMATAIAKTIESLL
jgi:lysophospholipase L1-like esterase